MSGRNGTVPTWVGNALLALAALTWLVVLVASATWWTRSPARSSHSP
ncbi:hypothetical protein AB0J20_27445 [Micromonospora costi]